MATTLFLILDDLSTDFTYGGPQNWTVNEQSPWYGRTSTYPEFANAQTSGSFGVSFEGISIAFSGNTPAATLSQSITVSIDGSNPYNTSYMDPTPQSYLQWYQSPTLSEGKHTIYVDGVAGTSLDYAIITVGQNTSLSGEKIIVDNDDPTIHYSGNWTRNTSKFFSGGDSKGLPFRNSTHRSTTPGDTITFLFSGTSLTVYGIFSWRDIGALAATYTIDGRTPVVGSHIVTTSSSEYVNGALEYSNFPFVLLDGLSAGDHTLVINVTQCLNHTFIFDYITYTPSFSNLASMPTLVFTPPTSTSASSALSSSSHAFQNSAGSKHAPVGAIVGGVVGGLVLVFIPLLIFWFRRRKARENVASPFGVSQKGKPENWNAPPPTQWAQTLPDSFRSPLDITTVSPFQYESSRTPAHLGLSTFADRKQVRNDNFPSATSGPSALSSAAMNNAASLSAPNPPNVTSPAIDLSSRVSDFSPPAYEAVLAHRRFALPSQ